MVFTNQTLGRAASLSHAGNEAAHGIDVSVFNHQSSTLAPAGKARSRNDRNPGETSSGDSHRSASRRARFGRAAEARPSGTNPCQYWVVHQCSSARWQLRILGDISILAFLLSDNSDAAFRIDGSRKLPYFGRQPHSSIGRALDSDSKGSRFDP